MVQIGNIFYVFIAIACNSFFIEAVVTSEGCGKNKTCMYIPSGCDISSSDCRFVSWSMSAAPDSIDIELRSAPVSQDDSYIAFAFGTVSAMMDADLYFCTKSELGNGVITEKHNPPVDMPLENGMNAESIEISEGRIHCKFTRPLSLEKTISSNNHAFNLTANEYYLLLAQGKMEGGVLTYHEWQYVTQDKINFVANFDTSLPTTKPAVHQPQVDPKTTPESSATMDVKGTPEPAPNMTNPEPEPTKMTTPEPQSTTSGSNAVFRTSWILQFTVASSMALYIHCV